MPGTKFELDEVMRDAPDGVVCVDEGGRVAYSNRAAERMLGRDPGELVGAEWSSLVRLIGARRARSSCDPTRALGTRPDGSTVALEASLAAHDTHEGKVTTAILRDMSLLDRALLTAQLADERQAFLSTAAHQLRAPIQPILNSLRTLERALARGLSPPPDTLSRALRQGLRLGRLVDTILKDAQALERGDIAVRVETFDLAALARDVVEDFRMALPVHRLRYEGPNEGVAVTSDADRVNQILITLIENALKYSAHQLAVKVEVSASESLALLRVVDEGIGIPEEEQERVFDKFYRGSNVPAAATGLGVGLYLAQGLARRLHGTLTVASEVGRGSAFSLSLPRKWPEADRSALPPGRRGSNGHVRHLG
ncbi:PAS domain-containing sensor histidine kinase [Polyangium aurulentum]|uniref:sensor histidine kinase n=1 Tax=Polyangium aurulentum TaxID=2567896 RepID=UPI0010ADDD09|nr:PAS domain-containing sensor histidine kinase [Polyangium aurulentum]UQA62649.1 PAS domain-containing sensor histidine kinase [Polyangium aurulentum]